MVKGERFVEWFKQTIKTNQWLGFFILMQGFLIIWGGVVYSIIPGGKIIDVTAILPYQQLAPGWDANPYLRFIVGPWYRWDACWYLYIAHEGYQYLNPGVSFAPLYPAMIRGLATLLGGQYILSGMIISQLSLLGVCYLLYDEFKKFSDPGVAHRAIRYFLGFPTVFFLFIPFSESLFLFLLVLCWRAGRDEKWWLAGIFGALATLTRFTGIVICVPLLYLWFRSKGNRKLLKLFSLGSIPLAFLLWNVFTKQVYGVFPWEAIGQTWDRNIGWPWEELIWSIKTISTHGGLKFYFLYNDLFMILLFTAIVIRMPKVLPVEYTILSAGFVLLYLAGRTSDPPLMSVSRYLLSVFPGFFVMANWGNSKTFHLIWTIFSFMWLLFLTGMFVSWGWVA
jgi:hypothetical protein